MHQVKKSNLNRLNTPGFQNNLWTILASGVSSVYIFLIVFITVRTDGIAEAGIISFAAAVVGLFSTIIVFGVRHFQSTDIKQKYSFNTYLGMRVCSALLASMGILLFLLISRFSTIRLLVILLFFFIYLTDGFADVFMGDLQQKGKMRIAGRMRVCAFGSSIVVFAIASLITQSLIIPLLLSGIAVFSVYIIWIWIYRTGFKQVRVKFDMKVIKGLGIEVLPLLIGSFIYSYLLSAPKYFLGFLDSDESVAILAMILVPFTVLSLLVSTFFAGAEMTKTARIYLSEKKKDLLRRVYRQLLLAFILAAAFMLGSFTLGIPILSWIYNVDLSDFMHEFTLVTLLGATNTLLIPLSVSLIVVRRLKECTVILLVSAVTSSLLLWFLVPRYGIAGAVFSNLIVFILITIAYYVVFRIALKKST